MISISADKKKTKKIKLWAVIFWLAVWQAASMAIGQEILLVSPAAVLFRLFQLVWTADFWQAVGFSLIRIAGGFFCAVIAGVIFAGLSARWQWFGQLLSPAILTIKAIPVASFIILVLIWISSKNLSILISFLMVLPIIYTNVLDGIGAVDKNLLEMAEVFQVPAGRRLRYIYISQVLPFFRSGCSIALGLCWKSGIAAEVIGIPDHSIGEHLYNAKVYLDTPDLFAWTLVIVLISIAFEKLFLTVLDAAVRYTERMV
ncbi:MAG TPA: ABC transporter permease subunit [Candidatus Scybalocola faecipullorum]|nr:ABC transporter permease subunit [Candidatus Scybalocola faecipullorum]